MTMMTRGQPGLGFRPMSADSTRRPARGSGGPMDGNSGECSGCDESRLTCTRLATQMYHLQRSTRSTRIAELEAELRILMQELQRLSELDRSIKRLLQSAELAAQLDGFPDLKSWIEAASGAATDNNPGAFGSRAVMRVMHRAHLFLLSQAKEMRVRQELRENCVSPEGANSEEAAREEAALRAVHRFLVTHIRELLKFFPELLAELSITVVTGDSSPRSGGGGGEGESELVASLRLQLQREKAARLQLEAELAALRNRKGGDTFVAAAAALAAPAAAAAAAVAPPTDDGRLLVLMQQQQAAMEEENSKLREKARVEGEAQLRLLQEAREELERQKLMLASAREELEAQARLLQAAREELDRQQQQLQDGRAELEGQQGLLGQRRAELEVQIKLQTENKLVLEGEAELLAARRKELEGQQGLLEQARGELEEQWKLLEQRRAELEAQLALQQQEKESLAAQQQMLLQAKLELETHQTNSRVELENQLRLLQQARMEVEAQALRMQQQNAADLQALQLQLQQAKMECDQYRREVERLQQKLMELLSQPAQTQVIKVPVSAPAVTKPPEKAVEARDCGTLVELAQAVARGATFIDLCGRTLEGELEKPIVVTLPNVTIRNGKLIMPYARPLVIKGPGAVLEDLMVLGRPKVGGFDADTDEKSQAEAMGGGTGVHVDGGQVSLRRCTLRNMDERIAALMVTGGGVAEMQLQG